MTPPATTPDWDAIARYLAGESNASEAAVVRSWLEANPGDRDLVQRLDSAASPDVPSDVDVEAALARVHQRMAAPERPALRAERGGAPAVAKSPRRAAIATIAAIAAAAVAVFVVTQNRTHAPPILNLATKHYTTGVGNTDSVLLADGSRVILGPQSTLEVPGTFGASQRIVTLTGDAYFDVHHDASKPFSVRAGSAVIEDIGTTFTIESDNGAVATVSVVAGSVRLSRDSSGPASGVVLGAGDRGSLNAAGEARVERNVVRAEDTQWISGRLAFRDAPLSRIAAEIDRWYGVKLRVADSAMMDRKVTTSFDGESVDKALQILELALGAKITRQGDSAVISGLRGAHPSR
jgi:transmembrane sensor